MDIEEPRESDVIEVDEEEFAKEALSTEETLLARLNRLTQTALDVYQAQMESGTPAQRLEASASILKNATALIKALKQPDQSGSGIAADGSDGSFFHFDFARSPEKAKEFIEVFNHAFKEGGEDEEYRVSAPVSTEGDEE